MAKLIQLFGLLDAKTLLERGKEAAFVRREPAPVDVDTTAQRLLRGKSATV